MAINSSCSMNYILQTKMLAKVSKTSRGGVLMFRGNIPQFSEGVKAFSLSLFFTGFLLTFGGEGNHLNWFFVLDVILFCCQVPSHVISFQSICLDKLSIKFNWQYVIFHHKRSLGNINVLYPQELDHYRMMKFCKILKV